MPAAINSALPFRSESVRSSKETDYYIDHIRLFPRHVHGVETFNACRNDFVNQMAELYAKKYELIPFSGSDNHRGAGIKNLGGMSSDTPIKDEYDFIERVKNGEMKLVKIKREI